MRTHPGQPVGGIPDGLETMGSYPYSCPPASSGPLPPTRGSLPDKTPSLAFLVESLHRAHNGSANEALPTANGPWFT